MTPGEPPPGLVDRAYSVGGHATDPVAPSGGELPDRTGLIRGLGIVQIVIGGICALMTLGLMLTLKTPGAILYGIAAVNLLATGIGSVRIAPSARRATIISSAIWMAIVGIGLVSFVYMLLAGRGLGVSGRPLAFGLVASAVMALFFLGLPITLVSAFTRPSVRATFERRRQSP